MTGSQGWRLTAWTGRLLLLGAVAFWWGAVVGPALFSLAFPSTLSPVVLPSTLVVETEKGLVHLVAVIALAVAALLALANCIMRRRDGLAAVVGWGTLAATATYLALDDGGWLYRWVNVRDMVTQIFDVGYRWPILISPAIAAFTGAMVVLVRSGARSGTTRRLLIFGLIAWLLAIIYDEATRGAIMPPGWQGNLSSVIEETLEFSGALLFGLAAATNLAKRQEAAMPFRKAALGAAVIVALLGGAIALDAVRLHRELLVDTRGEKVFSVVLWEGERSSLTQDIGTLPPTGRLRLRAAADGESAELVWRLRSGPNIVREGRVTVPARAEPQWFNIDFPPVVMDNPLSVQLVSGDNMRIGGTKTRELDHLQFRVNGMKTWPDQKLELTAYGPSDLTLDKLQAIWRNFKWTWPVLGVTSIFGLWIITFIPVLLVTAALPRRP